MWINLLAKHTTSWSTTRICSSVVSRKLKILTLRIVVPFWRQLSFGVFSGIKSSWCFILRNCYCDAKAYSCLMKLRYQGEKVTSNTTIGKPFCCTCSGNRLFPFTTCCQFCLFVLLVLLKKPNCCFFFPPLSLHFLSGRLALQKVLKLYIWNSWFYFRFFFLMGF